MKRIAHTATQVKVQAAPRFCCPSCVCPFCVGRDRCTKCADECGQINIQSPRVAVVGGEAKCVHPSCTRARALGVRKCGFCCHLIFLLSVFMTPFSRPVVAFGGEGKKNGFSVVYAEINFHHLLHVWQGRSINLIRALTRRLHLVASRYHRDTLFGAKLGLRWDTFFRRRTAFRLHCCGGWPWRKSRPPHSNLVSSVCPVLMLSWPARSNVRNS